MGRWAVEVTSMGGNMMLSHGHVGLSTAAAAMAAAIMGMLAMLSMVLGVCAQLHSRVQSKEISDGEMSVGSEQPRGSGGGRQGEGSRSTSSCSSKKRLLCLQQMRGCREAQDDHDEAEEEKQKHDQHELQVFEDAAGDEVGGLAAAAAAGNMESCLPVWQRSILMGERCEPPAFSGLILYDEHGNLVQDLPWRSPRHPPSPSLRQLMTST